MLLTLQLLSFIQITSCATFPTTNQPATIAYDTSTHQKHFVTITYISTMAHTIDIALLHS